MGLACISTGGSWSRFFLVFMCMQTLFLFLIILFFQIADVLFIYHSCSFHHLHFFSFFFVFLWLLLVTLFFVFFLLFLFFSSHCSFLFIFGLIGIWFYHVFINFFSVTFSVTLILNKRRRDTKQVKKNQERWRKKIINRCNQTRKMIMFQEKECLIIKKEYRKIKKRTWW